MIPNKLKEDAIVEAVCEIRFECDELPEIILGRLSDHAAWGDYYKNRLPASDIPAPIRAAEPNLKYQPVLELKNEDGTQIIKIGSNVITCNILTKYIGWDGFYTLIKQMVGSLFDALSNVRAVRIGLRYINILTKKRHFLDSVSDLNIDISVGDKQLTNSINLNYRSEISTELGIMSRVATSDFAQGNVPKDAVAIIDIDVATPDGFSMDNADPINKWVDNAHKAEKNEFFSLLPEEIINRLKES